MASLTGNSLSTTSIAYSIKPTLGSCFRVTNPSSVSLSTKGKSFPSIMMQPGISHFRFVCAAKPETVEKVCSLVRKKLALRDDQVVSGESKFSDLGADSLDLVETVMGLEEEFGINIEDETAESITTVADAAEIIDKLVEKKSA